MTGDPLQNGVSSLRLDKWLWFARLARTRSLAAKLCASGCVAVGSHAAAKPHHPVRVGDAVTMEMPRLRRVLIVRALGERRGPAAEARRLYNEEASLPREDAARNWVSLFAEEDEALDDQRRTQSL
ncbi:MAG: RNA-binding S4 domain-containing protein [Stellaceae bacterium]